MNSLIVRFSAVARAALLLSVLSFCPASVRASLSDHPEPARLDPDSARIPGSAKPVSAPAVPASAPTVPAAGAAVPASAPTVKPSLPAKPAPEPSRSAPGREEILSLARGGLLDSAYAVCKEALARDPENPFLLLMMGKLTPDGKQSAAYFKKAVQYGGVTPEAGESLFRLGQFNYAAGKYHLAIPFFRDYLNRFPTGDWKEPARYWMGNACLSLAQGRPDKAAYLDSGAASFQKLLNASKPEDYYYPLALEGLSKAMAMKGDREGAWKATRTALDKAPDEVQSPLLLLAAQLRQGVDRNEEKNLMARLVSRYPQSPEARYLRKVNSGVDTSRWKSGSGLPRPAVPAALDSVPPVAKPAEAAIASGKGAAGKAADSVKKSTETSTLPKAAAGEKPYTLQLGAFSQPANAQAMMSQLAKAGFAPELAESDRGGKRIYQVRLGRFASAEEAAEYARTALKPKKFLSQPVLLSP